MKCLAKFLLQKVHEAGDVGAVIVVTPNDPRILVELQRPSAKRVARVELDRNDPDKAQTLTDMIAKIKSPDQWAGESIEVDLGGKEGGEDVSAG